MASRYRVEDCGSASRFAAVTQTRVVRVVLDVPPALVVPTRVPKRDFTLTSASGNRRVAMWVLVAVLGMSFQVSCSDEIARPAAAPATLDIADGDDQIGRAAQTLGDSLVVIVRDAAGNPVPGVAVAWLVTAGGG